MCNSTFLFIYIIYLLYQTTFSQSKILHNTNINNLKNRRNTINTTKKSNLSDKNVSAFVFLFFFIVFVVCIFIFYFYCRLSDSLCMCVFFLGESGFCNVHTQFYLQFYVFLEYFLAFIFFAI